MTMPGPDAQELAARIDQLVDEQRLRCLWFLRPDYHPESDAARMRILEQIERHGDLDAYRRAATLRRWPSQTSSDASADS